MKYKPNDIEYLGCRKDKILSAKPILNREIFYMLTYWIHARQQIHIKKDLYNQEKPWTNDLILQSVRFTNVRREFDKQTQYLIKNVCLNNNLHIVDKLANIFLFRIINKKESLEGIFPIDFSQDLNFEFYRRWESHFPQDFSIFNKAYMISGPLGQIHSVCPDPSSFISVIKYVKLLYDNACFDIIYPMCTALTLFESLKSLKGTGNFLAYQMLIDLTYCPECPVSENEFVVAGPGCKQGLKLLFQNKDGMTNEECLFWLRNNWDRLCQEYRALWDPDKSFFELPKEDRYMNVMSLQNCFCELYKYNRAYNGGFIIKKYSGGNNEK